MTELAAAPLLRTWTALREAATAARGGWSHRLSAAVAVATLALAFPLVAPSSVRFDALAAGAYLALAAVGLGLCAGLAGIPSLGQGAFMGVGAFTTALLRVRAGWSLEPALLAGVAAAAGAGLVSGIGVVRLRGVFAAVSTWILAWLVAACLSAFPTVSGGAQGLVFPDEGRLLGLRLGPTAHYEVGVALTALAVAAYVALARERPGIALAALRQRPAAAAALGVPGRRLRLGAFTGAAAIAGLAGGLGVQLAGVADSTAYDPFLSFKLLTAVLIGGAAAAVGPVIGVAAIELTFLAANEFGSIVGYARERFNPVFDALFLLVVVATGTRGLWPFLQERARVLRPPPRSTATAPRAPAVASVTRETPILAAAELEKGFGAVRALLPFSIEIRGGTVEALIGPNGSGKTTALRLLAGALAPDGGRVLWCGRDVSSLPVEERARAGIVRTLQATDVFPELTVLENVLVGAGLRRSFGGAARTLAATPKARAETAVTEAAALEALRELNLEAVAERPAGELPGIDQRLLMLASALATAPSAMLIDEPAAGAGREELARFVAAIERFRDRGLAILVVEHNLRLVRAVADRVTVLDAGATVASGSVREVAADPQVREAYLGRQVL